jgi:hypothetical protein
MMLISIDSWRGVFKVYKNRVMLVPTNSIPSSFCKISVHVLKPLVKRARQRRN